MALSARHTTATVATAPSIRHRWPITATPIAVMRLFVKTSPATAFRRSSASFLPATSSSPIKPSPGRPYAMRISTSTACSPQRSPTTTCGLFTATTQPAAILSAIHTTPAAAGKPTNTGSIPPALTTAGTNAKWAWSFADRRQSTRFSSLEKRVFYCPPLSFSIQYY